MSEGATTASEGATAAIPVNVEDASGEGVTTSEGVTAHEGTTTAAMSDGEERHAEVYMHC